MFLMLQGLRFSICTSVKIEDGVLAYFREQAQPDPEGNVFLSSRRQQVGILVLTSRLSGALLRTVAHQHAPLGRCHGVLGRRRRRRRRGLRRRG